MPRTHPYLRGLAETRARADGQCSALEHQIGILTRSLQKARTERESCDSLIRRFNPNLLPEAIEPISEGQRNQYGTRGALTKEMLAALQQAYPDSISTSAIALHVESAFQLSFATRTERRNWVCKSLSNRLSSFARENVIERLHNPLKNIGKPGCWRWIPVGQPVASLQALAAQAGVTTTYALDQDDPAAPGQPAEPVNLAEEDNLPR